jgi:hypothetical protein
MNRKQRVLTIIALVAFVVIGVLRYLGVTLKFYYLTADRGIWLPNLATYPTIDDVRVPWFMLGVIYTGLFFLLADRKERR